MFRIVIEEVTEVETVKQEYQRIADTGNERDKGAVYDYVKYPSTQTKTVKILEQNVETVDVKAVVKAVLGI